MSSAAAHEAQEKLLVATLLAEVEMLRERLATTGSRTGAAGADASTARQSHLVDKVLKLLDTRKASLGIIADLEARLGREGERYAALAAANRALEAEKATAAQQQRALTAKAKELSAALVASRTALQRKDEAIVRLNESLAKKSELLKAHVNRAAAKTPPRSPTGSLSGTPLFRPTSMSRMTSFGRSPTTEPLVATEMSVAAPQMRTISPTDLPSRRAESPVATDDATSDVGPDETTLASPPHPVRQPEKMAAVPVASDAAAETIDDLRGQLTVATEKAAAAERDLDALRGEHDALRGEHDQALQLMSAPRALPPGSAFGSPAGTPAGSPRRAEASDVSMPPVLPPAEAGLLVRGVHTLLADWGRAAGRVEGLARAVERVTEHAVSRPSTPTSNRPVPYTTRLPPHARRRAARVMLTWSQRALLSSAYATWQRVAAQAQVERRYHELVGIIHIERRRAELFRSRLADDLARRRAGGTVYRYFHLLRRFVVGIRMKGTAQALRSVREEQVTTAAALVLEQTLRQTKEEQVRAVVSEIRLVHLDKEDLALRWDIEREKMTTHVKATCARAVRGWEVGQKRRLRSVAYTALRGYATLARERRLHERKEAMSRAIMRHFKKSREIEQQHIISRDFIGRDEASEFLSLINWFHEGHSQLTAQYVSGLREHAMQGYVALSSKFCEMRSLAVSFVRLQRWAHRRQAARAEVTASIERSGQRAASMVRLHSEGDATVRIRAWRKWAIHAATSRATKHVEIERTKHREAMERATEEMRQLDLRHHTMDRAHILRHLSTIARESEANQVRSIFQTWMRFVLSKYMVHKEAAESHEEALEVQLLITDQLNEELTKTQRLHERTHRLAIDLLEKMNHVRTVHDHWVAWRAFVKSRAVGYHRMRDHLRVTLAENWVEVNVKLRYARLLIKWLGWEWRRRGRDMVRMEGELDTAQGTTEKLIHKLQTSGVEVQRLQNDRHSAAAVKASLEEANAERYALQALNDDLRAHQERLDTRQAALAALYSTSHEHCLQLGLALAALDGRMAETARLPLAAQWGDVMVFLHSAKKWWKNMLLHCTHSDTVPSVTTPLMEHVARAGGMDALVLGSP